MFLIVIRNKTWIDPSKNNGKKTVPIYTMPILTGEYGKGILTLVAFKKRQVSDVIVSVPVLRFHSWVCGTFL